MVALDKELTLNLCDLGHQNNLQIENYDELKRRIDFLVENASRCVEKMSVSRIYVGSYFCDRFFLSLSSDFFEVLARYVRANELSLSLVVPVFGQSTLAQGRQRIDKLLNDKWDCSFDEAVVNDPAMALFVRAVAPNLALHYGRMMAKTHRDPRHVEMEAQAQGYVLDKQQTSALKEQFGYAMAEIDPTAPQVSTEALDGALPLALHLPHCFMTTGHICQAASDGLPMQSKFRPDAPCRQQCLRAIQVYEHYQYETEKPVYFTRAGRTIYFENPTCEIIGQQPARIIWTPADFMCSRSEVSELEGGTTWA